MKLLQINATANWGSTGRIAEQIGLKAMEHGWESYIAYGRKSNSSKSNLIRVGSKLNPYMHFAQQFLFDSEGLNSIYPTRQLVKKIKTLNPDIIHLHNIHDHWLNYKILFEYLNTTNTPIIWTQHDCWAFTGGCMHFSSLNCSKWKIECHNCPRSKKSIDNSIQQFNLRKHLFTANKNLILVPVSKWLENERKQSFLKDTKISIILNGVDIDTFKPLQETNVRNKYNIGNKFILMGLATAWSIQKGFKDYIELSKYIGDDEVIVLVGLKKEQIKKLPSNVIGIERTSNIQELVELYSTADIILNLSYQETFGLTSAEGFACGTPGVVYNKTASPELIEGEVGFVVEAGNIKQLLEAINTIKNKGKNHYSTYCRQRAIDYYDKEKCFEKYIKLYEECLKKALCNLP